ncbi:MAG: glycosyltransferase 87 family protein, partial [Candidatus Omnitrophica bacterium]|nr:glycosyltransferase 87 family protein [Candidatus Omnitrophota bacterium]
LALILSALILFKLIPSPAFQTGIRNLKLSILLAMPLIGYELSNSQNKIFALFFVLLAILLFERKRMFLSALSLNIAAVIYVPIVFFALYFILRSRGRFIPHFILALAAVFIILPSIVFGFSFNNFLLQEWFKNSLNPFALTSTYSSYIDLRSSSHSLPSAVGRMLVSGSTGSFNYRIPAHAIHMIIKGCSAGLLLISSAAIWKKRRDNVRGLGYILFLFLALLLPQYCIYYTWAWLFVAYFVLLNCLSDPQLTALEKRILLISIFVLVFSSFSIVIHLFNHFSFLFFGTLAAWSGITFVLFAEKEEPDLKPLTKRE